MSEEDPRELMATVMRAVNTLIPAILTTALAGSRVSTEEEFEVASAEFYAVIEPIGLDVIGQQMLLWTTKYAALVMDDLAANPGRTPEESIQRMAIDHLADNPD